MCVVKSFTLMADMETLADFAILGEESKESYSRIQTLTTWNRGYHGKQTKKWEKGSSCFKVSD